MKNSILVFLSSLLLINTSAFADTTKHFYLKAIIGSNKISGIKTIEQDINFKVVQNSKISPIFGGGIGYYINPNTRLDLTFENTKLNFLSKRANFSYEDSFGINTGNQLIIRDASIDTIMLNAYTNILNRESFNIFIGTGIGNSSIKEKITSSFKLDDTIIKGETVDIPPVVTTKNRKVKNNLSYSFTIGSDIDLKKYSHLELVYSWKHYGSVKSCSNKYEGHNMSASIRFDL